MTSSSRDTWQGAAFDMRFYCLGRFQVYLGGRPTALRGSGKGPLVLKYLATCLPAPVQRDVLLSVCWPDTQPDVANNRLKVAIHHLRGLFFDAQSSHPGEQGIIFQNGCYLLDPDFTVWTDVAAFEEAWRTAQRLEREGRLAASISFYEQAKALYAGDFLEEDRTEEWTFVRREHLRDRYLTIVDKLSCHWYQTGQRDRAIEGWRGILAMDPWREDVYRRLMASLAEKGQRGLALRWHQICVQVLKDQLAIEPEPETEALYQRIRVGADVSAWVGA